MLVLLAPQIAKSADLRGGRIRLERFAPGLAALAESLQVQSIAAPYEDLFEGAPVDGPPDGPEARLRRRVRLVLPAGADARAAAARLAGTPGVETAEPDVLFHLAGTGFFPDDPQFADGTQWGLWNTGAGVYGGVPGTDIRAPLGWAITTGSTSTILGIVDTGFDLSHPELAGTLADGTPRIIHAFNSSIEGSEGSPWDSVGHGTIVAGVAFARSNNGPVLDGRGIAGVCGGSGGDSSGCRIVEVKATPTRLTDALGSELAKGITYAVVAGARAINLSFGGDDDNSDVRDAMSFAQKRGAVVICGAGNGQDERPQYPGYYARYGDGVSVAAIKSDGQLANFSTHGAQIDVAAPGQDIFSTMLTYQNAYNSPLRNFVAGSGTSFAAPHVTGLAGLAFTVQPDMIDNEFQAVLRRTARDVGAPGRDNTYGWGIPDAPALLAALLPPRGFLRGSVLADSWTSMGYDSVTLSKTRKSVNGCSIDGKYFAERIEVRAHVTLPPGALLETPQVIVRPHGTNGLGGWPNSDLLEYDGLDFGEVVPGTESQDGFTLRTYVYRIDAPGSTCTNPGSIDYVPQEPRFTRFAWSALGIKDGPPTVTIDWPRPGDVVPVDSLTTIRWHATDPDSISLIALDYSTDGGLHWTTLQNLAGNPGEAAWHGPCGLVGGDFRLRVRALDRHGIPDEGSAMVAFVPDRLCLVGENPTRSFALLPPTPNPSRGPTAFHYYLAFGDTAPTTIEIFDVRGRRVRVIRVDGTLSGPGGATWDGKDEAGRIAPAGLYVARLDAGPQHVASRRFVRL